MGKKLALFLTLFAFGSVITTGCYGPFKLTKKLNNWNNGVGDKWVNEGVFLMLVILPVYGISVLGDAIVFNSLEFWTGNNPIAFKGSDKDTKTVQGGNSKAVLSYQRSSNTLEIITTKENGDSRTLTLEPTQEGYMAAKDGKGHVLMVAKTLGDGGIIVENSRGGMVAKYSSDRVKDILK